MDRKAAGNVRHSSRQGLSDPQEDVRARTVLALARCDDAEEILLQMLVADESPTVRLICASSIPCVTETAAAGLRQALRDPFHRVVAAARRSLAEGDWRSAITEIQPLLKHPDWTVRRCAVEACLALGATDRNVLLIGKELTASSEAEQYDHYVRAIRQGPKLPFEGKGRVKRRTVGELVVAIRGALHASEDGC
jgi:HEAT repeat protein